MARKAKAAKTAGVPKFVNQEILDNALTVFAGEMTEQMKSIFQNIKKEQLVSFQDHTEKTFGLRHQQLMTIQEESVLAQRENTRLTIEAAEQLNGSQIRQMANFHNMHANVMTSLIRAVSALHNTLFWIFVVGSFGVILYAISKIVSA